MASNDSGAQVLPVYFVADESYSMIDYMPDLNEGMTDLLDALQQNPFAAAKVRFSIIGFGTDAVTHLEPTDLRNLGAMPKLTERGSTSYLAAFQEIAFRIAADIPNLKGQGHQVLRPAVFFLTDGAPNPNEDWRSELKQLMAGKAYPNLLAFGIGDANASTISEVASQPRYAFMAKTGAKTGAMLNEFMAALVQSVVSSGNSVGQGGGIVVEQPKSFEIATELM